MEAIIAINANIMDVYLSLKKYVSLKDNCSKYHEEHRKKAAEKNFSGNNIITVESFFLIK